MTSNKINNMNNMSGGLFSKLVKKSKYSFNDVVKKTKKSEGNLINAYEDLDTKAKKYNKSYVEHIENIKMLDDYVNFNGMETLFNKVIMQDNFVKGRIDKTNPLLFRNYIIEGEVLPSTFRREHLMNQIRYFMNKSIPGRDQSFIKYITVTDISKHDFVLNTVTIDNIKQKKVIPHSDFLIDKEKTKTFIIDVVSSTMKKLKRTSKVAEFDDDDVDYRKTSKDSKSKSRYGKSRDGKTKKTDNDNDLFDKISKKSKSKGKNKSKSNSVSIYKFSNIKHTKSQSKKSNKPKEKLNEYMTSYEIHQRNEKRKAEKQAAEKQAAEIKKKAEYPEKIPYEDKKAKILGGPLTGIAQGLPEQKVQPESDPIKAKCEAHGSDEAMCNANKPDCFFSKKALRCFKSNPDYKPAGNFGIGNPPPTLVNLPKQDPLTIPQQTTPPEKLL